MASLIATRPSGSWQQHHPRRQLHEGAPEPIHGECRMRRRAEIEVMPRPPPLHGELEHHPLGLPRYKRTQRNRHPLVIQIHQASSSLIGGYCGSKACASLISRRWRRSARSAGCRAGIRPERPGWLLSWRESFSGLKAAGRDLGARCRGEDERGDRGLCDVPGGGIPDCGDRPCRLRGDRFVAQRSALLRQKRKSCPNRPSEPRRLRLPGRQPQVDAGGSEFSRGLGDR